MVESLPLPPAPGVLRLAGPRGHPPGSPLACPEMRPSPSGAVRHAPCLGCVRLWGRFPRHGVPGCRCVRFSPSLACGAARARRGGVGAPAPRGLFALAVDSRACGVLRATARSPDVAVPAGGPAGLSRVASALRRLCGCPSWCAPGGRRLRRSVHPPPALPRRGRAVPGRRCTGRHGALHVRPRRSVADIRGVAHVSLGATPVAGLPPSRALVRCRRPRRRRAPPLARGRRGDHPDSVLRVVCNHWIAGRVVEPASLARLNPGKNRGSSLAAIRRCSPSDIRRASRMIVPFERRQPRSIHSPTCAARLQLHGPDIVYGSELIRVRSLPPDARSFRRSHLVQRCSGR